MPDPSCVCVQLVRVSPTSGNLQFFDSFIQFDLHTIMDSVEASNWGVVACLALPHLLYAFIWFFPQRWMAAFKKSSVVIFENVAWALKGMRIQLCSLSKLIINLES